MAFARDDREVGRHARRRERVVEGFHLLTGHELARADGEEDRRVVRA